MRSLIIIKTYRLLGRRVLATGRRVVAIQPVSIPSSKLRAYVRIAKTGANVRRRRVLRARARENGRAPVFCPGALQRRREHGGLECTDEGRGWMRTGGMGGCQSGGDIPLGRRSLVVVVLARHIDSVFVYSDRECGVVAMCCGRR